MKRFSLHSFFMLCVNLFIAGLLASLIIAYVMIKKFTQRPYYSVARQEEHLKERNFLINNCSAQPVSFFADDGVRLAGLLVLRSHAKRNLLLCHGYRMSKERMRALVTMFQDYNILLFDYRAHGESEGDLTTIGYQEKNDVIAALNFIKKHEATKKFPIFAIGVSMGAVSLLAAIGENNDVKGAVLDSPFLRLDEQAKRTMKKRYYLPSFPFAFIGNAIFSYLMNFSLHDVNALSWAAKAKTPVLIIHSVKDETAYLADAKQIYEALTSQKKLWLVNESGHARIFNDYIDEYKENVNGFFNELSCQKMST